MAQRRRPYRLAGTTKALPAALTTSTAGQVRTADQVTALAQLHNQMGTVATPLPRDLYPYQFGPGIPLNPAPLDPVRRDTGRAEPRIYDYPVSWNLPGQQGRLIPFSVLRRAAEMPILADCIRIRKEEISTLQWEIGVSPRAVGAVQREQPGTSRHIAEKTIRESMIPEIERLTHWWQEPDRGNGYTFEQWITQLLDERLVIDALAIYPRCTLGGDLYAFEILDGATIKPLLDHRGGRPMPPEPAYQQQLHGFPRGEFTADVSVDEDGTPTIPGGYPADQLIYRRRDVRTWTPYGRSPVEMALLDLDTWMKRQAWIRAEYTDGVMPGGWLRWSDNNPDVMWSPQQVLEYETALNDLLSGDTAARKRWRMLPPGVVPEPAGAGEAERYKPEYDLFLLKLLVAHFDMTIHELGFTETQGLGSAGHQVGQENLNERKGSKPTLKAIQAILTDISRAHLGMPPELEFRWTDLATDEGDADTVIAEQVGAGLLTLNEGRDETGRPRYDFAEADMPALYAPRTGTITFLEGASIAEQPPVEQDAGFTGATAQPGAPGQDKPRPGTAPPGSDGRTGGEGAKAAEAAAYHRWARKGRLGRRFELQLIASPPELAFYGIDPDRVMLGKAVGGPTPERVAQWPGWTQDQDAARERSRQLREAVRRAFEQDALLLAGWWLDRAVDTMSLTAAVAFLAGHGINDDAMTAAIRPAIEGMAEDGARIGAASAELLTGASGAPPSAVLGDVASIAHHRVEQLAQILANPTTTDPDTLGRQLQQAINDPAWADEVAVTETSRAVNEAARRVYEHAGIATARWLSENDTRVCPVCDRNEAAGPVLLGHPYPSGDVAPPAHPRCRCVLLPVLEG